MDSTLIRNFAIVAHVDHGKSTLADRLLEMTKTVAARDMGEQMLDSNPIERERGITIKLAPVRMQYTLSPEQQKKFNSQSAILNLIDTPGHVDFSYEVSRSLAACEGILLVVDATQGIQAQTLAYMQLIKERDLKVIPIINKVDLPIADVPKTREQIRTIFGFADEDMIEISGKTGLNVESVLEAIITRIPGPKKSIDKPLRGLVFSSTYDAHRGVVVFVRIVDGQIKPPLVAAPLRFMASGAEFTPIEVGYFTPRMTVGSELSNGEVGYIATGLKDVHLAGVGDTVTFGTNTVGQVTSTEQLPGYKPTKPMVFMGLFPVASDDFVQSRESLEKLNLSDSAFTYKPISSQALGKGFHCGFLGLLHAEVVQERLDREFGLNMIATTPTVEYRITKTNGEEAIIQSAEDFPDPSVIKEIREPLMMVTLFSPNTYVGAIMPLVQEKRGVLHDMEYLGDQVKFTYTIPLAEIILDFFDRLKSVTSGYASMDYEFFSFEPVNAVKLDILVHHEKVDALSSIVVKDQANRIGGIIVDKLKDVIPRQQFAIPIQAAIGGKIVARSDVKPFRKDVTQKLYGGDRTRKDKLLEKQKKGKKKMRMIGAVEIPQEAFLAVLKR